jgi:hypothetical protein
MTRAELEAKHLAELHALAAEAGVARYRMLARAELISQLAGETEPRVGEPAVRTRPERAPRSPRRSAPAVRSVAAEPGAEAAPEPTGSAARPRRRRRRRFRRRGRQGVRLSDLLLPPQGGRQTIVYAETREACTAVLRELAAELGAASKGPDPVVLLVDPGPEELADWKREAPQAEIVAAAQARHAADALAQAAGRAGGGEDVILLVDSLSRLGQAYGDADSAKEFFDSGRDLGGSAAGSLTVVAALEPPASD